MCAVILGCLALWTAPALVAGAATVAAVAADDAAPVRVEARSTHYFVVALVRGETMNIHVSRLLDNAAVRDATVVATLRGSSYPATALADGGYSIKAKELSLPGSAEIDLLVSRGTDREHLTFTLNNVPPTPKAEDKDKDKNSVRQIGWWILNFAVCIGFLMLVARRRKAAES